METSFIQPPNKLFTYLCVTNPVEMRNCHLWLLCIAWSSVVLPLKQLFASYLGPSWKERSCVLVQDFSCYWQSASSSVFGQSLFSLIFIVKFFKFYNFFQSLFLINLILKKWPRLVHNLELCRCETAFSINITVIYFPNQLSCRNAWAVFWSFHSTYWSHSKKLCTNAQLSVITSLT